MVIPTSSDRAHNLCVFHCKSTKYDFLQKAQALHNVISLFVEGIVGEALGHHLEE